MIVYGILLSLFAGAAIPLGALLARVRFCRESWLRNEIKHGLIGFGAGALIAAMAFVLIPEGSERQPPLLAMGSFLFGGLVFMQIDYWLAHSKNQASQFLAMMLDFVPEAIVLGALMTHDLWQAAYLAVIIFAQNIPEGYAAFTEMEAGVKSKRNLLAMFLLTGLSGPLYVLLGTYVFAEYELILGFMMTFCAGGILYLLFQDMAPRVATKKHRLPPLGTIGGFLIGYAGYLYL